MSLPKSRTYDVIVIGAGHSGLVAAWYLATAGQRVLVLERREIVGGTCVTEEIFPGFRGSSVANSCHSLDPRTVRDMRLEQFGLRFTRPELSSLTMFADGQAFVPWPDRVRREAEIKRLAHSQDDVDGYYEVLRFFQSVAQQMNVSFYDAAPTLASVADRFHTPQQQRAFNSVIFGSVADLLDEYLLSPELKAFFAGTAVATNMVGPRTPGSAYLLLQRPLWEESMRRVGTRDENEMMMKNWAPIGGVGAVTEAMAASDRAAGVQIEVGAEVARIVVRNAKAAGVLLSDGREFSARIVLSNADPRFTLTELIEPDELGREWYDLAKSIDLKGSSAKVHLALRGTPRFACARSDEENEMLLKTNFRVVPSVEALQEAYNQAVLGSWTDRPTIAGVIPSAVDPSLTPPGCHFVSLSVRGVPYHLASGTWDEQRDALGKAVIATLGEHVPNLSDVLSDFHVYTPLDLERQFGLVEGNGAHGDIVPGHLFDSRPMPGCANYRTPLDGLYLCGVGVWPANFMSGVTGYNASQRILRDVAGRGPNDDSMAVAGTAG